MDRNAGFHLGGTTIDAKILPHSQQPRFNIFPFLIVTFKNRRFNLLKFSLQLIPLVPSSSYLAWSLFKTAPWLFWKIVTSSWGWWRVTGFLTLRNTSGVLLFFPGLLSLPRIGVHLSLNFIQVVYQPVIEPLEHSLIIFSIALHFFLQALDYFG